MGAASCICRRREIATIGGDICTCDAQVWPILPPSPINPTPESVLRLFHQEKKTRTWMKWWWMECMKGEKQVELNTERKIERKREALRAIHRQHPLRAPSRHRYQSCQSRSRMWMFSIFYLLILVIATSMSTRLSFFISAGSKIIKVKWEV